jgi:mannose-6-phosphate isomerase-like protein (cupin superfamily)
MPHFYHIEGLGQQHTGQGKPFLEFLRVPAMSAGIYVLPKGSKDSQKPHDEDEIYYVIRGHARMQIGDESSEVRPGSLIFVEAGAKHRFYEIDEDLEVLVVFAPAEQA